MLVDLIYKYYTESERDREWSTALRASNSGKCTKAIAYQYHGFEAQPLNARARLVFRLGDLIEQDLVDVSSKFGLERMQEEVSLIVGGHEIKGHIDGILGDVVVDFKSTTTFGMTKAKKGDVGDYIYQMHFYMKALGFTRALIVYYCKQTSHLHEVEIKWDEAIWQEIEKKFTTVLNSTPVNLPERDYEPNADGKLPWQCSYCAYNRHCWPNYKLEFDKNFKPSLIIGEELTSELDKIMGNQMKAERLDTWNKHRT